MTNFHLSYFLTQLVIAGKSFRDLTEDECPEGIRKLISDCTSFDPKCRPYVKEVNSRLGKIQQEIRPASLARELSPKIVEVGLDFGHYLLPF